MSSQLTPRELEILCHASKGLVAKDSHLLNITAWTYKRHLTHIFRKLDVCNTVHAVATAIREGWIK